MAVVSGRDIPHGQWSQTELDPDVALQQKTAKELQQYDWERKLQLYGLLSKERSGVTTSLQNMINQYNQAFQLARTQNEQKYQQQLSAVGQTSGQQRTDVLNQYQQQRSSAMQNLARLGMANTTIAPTLQSGIQREQQGALNRISDQELAAKLGVMQGFEYKYPEPGITQAAIQAMAPNYSYPSL